MAYIEERGAGFRVTVSVPGGKPLKATFPTRAAAIAWGAEMESRKVTAPGRLLAVGKIVRDVFDGYLDDHAGQTDSARWNRYRLAAWSRDPLALIPISEVGPHDLVKWRARRMAAPGRRPGTTVSVGTVDRELTLMSGAFRYAIEVRKWMTENPCRGMVGQGYQRPRDRPLLTVEELTAIAAAGGYSIDRPIASVAQRVVACFLLAIETGMRSGEILRLRPRDYHRDRPAAFVSATERGGRKGARSGRDPRDPSRWVPLTGEAIRLLDQLVAAMPGDQKPRDGQSDPPYIVGLTDAQRDANWRRVRGLAGVRELTYHDSKHEAATRLARHLDVFALSHATGNRDLRQLRDTYYRDDVEASAAKLPARLGLIHRE